MNEAKATDQVQEVLKLEAMKITERLDKSLTDLESAIHGARANLERLGHVPAEVMQRLDSYFSIIEKQRTLASNIEDLICGGDSSEVGRHIGLINALSGMIIDDARGILSGLNGNDLPVNDDHFC